MKMEKYYLRVKRLAKIINVDIIGLDLCIAEDIRWWNLSKRGNIYNQKIIVDIR